MLCCQLHRPSEVHVRPIPVHPGTHLGTTTINLEDRSNTPDKRREGQETPFHALSFKLDPPLSPPESEASADGDTFSIVSSVEPKIPELSLRGQTVSLRSMIGLARVEQIAVHEDPQRRSQSKSVPRSSRPSTADAFQARPGRFHTTGKLVRADTDPPQSTFPLKRVHSDTASPITDPLENPSRANTRQKIHHSSELRPSIEEPNTSATWRRHSRASGGSNVSQASAPGPFMPSPLPLAREDPWQRPDSVEVVSRPHSQQKTENLPSLQASGLRTLLDDTSPHSTHQYRMSKSNGGNLLSPPDPLRSFPGSPGLGQQRKIGPLTLTRPSSSYGQTPPHEHSRLPTPPRAPNLLPPFPCQAALGPIRSLTPSYLENSGVLAGHTSRSPFEASVDPFSASNTTPQPRPAYSPMPAFTPSTVDLASSALFRCNHEDCTAPPFQTQYLLNSHAKVHSQDRPHYCPVADCPRGKSGKGFKRKNEMKRHRLVHDSPGFVCPFCVGSQHAYPRPDNLLRHVRVHHQDRSIDDPQLRQVLSYRIEGGPRARRKRKAE